MAAVTGTPASVKIYEIDPDRWDREAEAISKQITKTSAEEAQEVERRRKDPSFGEMTVLIKLPLNGRTFQCYIRPQIYLNSVSVPQLEGKVQLLSPDQRIAFEYLLEKVIERIFKNGLLLTIVQHCEPSLQLGLNLEQTPIQINGPDVKRKLIGSNIVRSFTYKECTRPEQPVEARFSTTFQNVVFTRSKQTLHLIERAIDQESALRQNEDSMVILKDNPEKFEPATGTHPAIVRARFYYLEGFNAKYCDKEVTAKIKALGLYQFLLFSHIYKMVAIFVKQGARIRISGHVDLHDPDIASENFSTSSLLQSFVMQAMKSGFQMPKLEPKKYTFDQLNGMQLEALPIFNTDEEEVFINTETNVITGFRGRIFADFRELLKSAKGTSSSSAPWTLEAFERDDWKIYYRDFMITVFLVRIELSDEIETTKNGMKSAIWDRMKRELIPRSAQAVAVTSAPASSAPPHSPPLRQRSQKSDQGKCTVS